MKPQRERWRPQAGSPDPMIPSRDEMRALLPLVRRGQPEATSRWFRGAVYYHALRTGKPDPVRQGAEAALWGVGSFIVAGQGWTWAAVAILLLALWRVSRSRVPRSQAEAMRIALSPPVMSARFRVETV